MNPMARSVFVILLVAGGCMPQLECAVAQSPRSPPSEAPTTPGLSGQLLYRSPVYEAIWKDRVHAVNTAGLLVYPVDATGPRRVQPFCPFYVAFWTREHGYLARREVAEINIETSKPPARALSPALTIRVRVQDERRSRMDAKLLFESNSITIEATARLSPSDNNPVMHGTAFFYRAPGVPGHDQPREGVDLERLCAGMYLDLLDAKGATNRCPFWEQCDEKSEGVAFAVTRYWPGWIISGQRLDRRGAFRYWQYAGTRPAEGFGLAYVHTGLQWPEARVTIRFDRVRD